MGVGTGHQSPELTGAKGDDGRGVCHGLALFLKQNNVHNLPRIRTTIGKSYIYFCKICMT